MNETSSVRNLKVSVTRTPELKESKSGKKYLKFSAIYEKDDGEKVWLDCLAFGSIAEPLGSVLAKGKRALLSGRVKSEELPDKKNPGSVYVRRTVFVNEAKVPGDGGVVTIDEFGTHGESAPF